MRLRTPLVAYSINYVIPPAYIEVEIRLLEIGNSDWNPKGQWQRSTVDPMKEERML